jgi:predicted secreted protein
MKENKMKSKIFISTMFLGIVLLAGGCGFTTFASSATSGTSVNPDNKVPPAPNKYLVSIAAEDFNKEAHILRQVEVKAGDVFTILLDSNATTGFRWTEQAKIADGNILKQTEHAYVAPQTNDSNNPVAGMSGIEEWWFTAGKTGVTTATMSYDRPWEGGEKGVRTFVLTVVVK